MKYRSLTQYILQGRSLSHTDPLSQVQHFSIKFSLQDMKQNRWTIKYRSLTYIYLIRSIYVSHWSIIPTMMFIHQMNLKILSKTTRPWNIGHVDLYLLWAQSKFGSHCLIVLVLRAGYGIWLYQFLIIAYLFTLEI